MMKLFGLGVSSLRGDDELGFDDSATFPRPWVDVSAVMQARIDFIQINFDHRSPAFHVARTNDPLTFCLFSATHSPASFTFPLSSKQTKQWVVGVFDKEHMTFQNAMFIGSFKECAVVLTQGNLSKLRTLYAKAVSELEPHTLAPLRTSLQNKMLAEIEEAEAQHQMHIASIRNRHRNQLNYFTGLFDEAQERQDKRDKAQYHLDFLGFPPSKTYDSLKVARRTHSKRNIPHIDCYIVRRVGKASTLFAQWSTEDRIWIIL